MKTKEELKALKEEYITLNNKLKELSDDEIKEITGGFDIPTNDPNYEINIYPEEVLDADDFKKKF